MMAYKLLIINPGSTSTKIGVYSGEKEVLVETLRHSAEEIGKYDTIFDQKGFRKEVIMKVLKENNIDVNSLDAIVGRGGMLRPIPGGTYEVTDKLLEDLKVGVSGQHASNLGGILAHEIAKEVGIKSFIVDPVVVDELQDIARISGMPELPRRSIFHALNQKASLIPKKNYLCICMKQILYSRPRIIEALIHIIGWGIVFAFPFVMMTREVPDLRF